jgi:hypothetical protein
LPACHPSDFREDRFELLWSWRTALPARGGHAIAMSPDASLPLLPVLSPIFQQV